ncbi:MAG TPA: methyltransferase domain-containing protein [Thermodesulfobacteriota bacterium]|nr:methyltransferase domain-containing protein [Thermodesulfobacteriota bacterium]
MAIKCPLGFDVNHLRELVHTTYDRVAHEPNGQFHFHRGLDYACEYLKYNREELESLPEECTARFAGVGNPNRVGTIKPGQTVLDHACGAGMDLLIAARRIGPTGKAIGVDMTKAMRDCAKAAAEKAGLSDIVDIREGFFEDLPVEDESVDVIISNGVVNLSPDKEKVFKEIFRVLKPGGCLFLADVVVQRELKLEARSNPDLWAACIAGALPELELFELSSSVGLSECQILERFDCFKNTSAEVKVSKDLYVQGVNFFARK